MAKQPAKPEPAEEAETEDTRSDLQKAEEAEAEAFAALPPHAKAASLLDDLIKRMQHQVKHNAPVGPHLLAELQAIREHLPQFGG